MLCKDLEATLCCTGAVVFPVCNSCTQQACVRWHESQHRLRPMQVQSLEPVRPRVQGLMRSVCHRLLPFPRLQG